MRSESVPCAIAVFALAGLVAGHAVAAQASPPALVTIPNPDPQNLPTLAVWEETQLSQGKKLTMVSARFPNVPDFVCDGWCYESEVDFVEARALAGGRLEMRHRLREHPHVLLVSTLTPEPGAVELVGRAVLDPEDKGGGELPANLLTPNLCWQVRHAPAFASAPDPYPEFVKRCFIFTKQGMTFLHQTTRRRIPVRPAGDPYNHPPWVQMYVGDWQQVPQSGTNAWADYSPDRYATTLIGVVSRGGKFLAAIGTDSATVMAQAWHDCLHNNPQWQPASAAPGARVWRLKIYAMANDPPALLARFARDFPNARKPPTSNRTTNNASTIQVAAPAFQSPGVVRNLPAFHERLAERMTFPLSWLQGRQGDFDAWRRQARAKVMECLFEPPPAAPFAATVLAEQARGSYVARKVAFNLTSDSRVLAYLLVPTSTGPHPAVLLLHDHGAKFDIGKEKVIEPWNDTPGKLEFARQWVQKYYGSRFIGDELAKRGYVCLATDMLNWSDRGGGGYEGQEKLAANLLQFGTSFAGVIAHEDLRAAEFLASQPEVDAKRIAAMGLSVGGFRTWQLAALSDRIAVGVSVCWMATRKGLLVPGNNQTTGQSAFTMTHPGLANFLDYPDVASLACPKPMMFQAGRGDALFPVASVEEAFGKMRRVWESQNAGTKLETRFYDAPHEFNAAMQNEAFAWLERWMQPAR